MGVEDGNAIVMTDGDVLELDEMGLLRGLKASAAGVAFYPLPDGFDDLQAAPLLCAGIIGFRCLRMAGVARGTQLGFYGFGAAAHVALQVANYWGARVSVCTVPLLTGRAAVAVVRNGAVVTVGDLGHVHIGPAPREGIVAKDSADDIVEGISRFAALCGK